MNKTRLIVVSLIIIAAVALRVFLADVPNVAPITAMALFAGMFFERKFLAFVIPAVTMLISDLFIGFHSTMWAVYGSFALIALIGIYLEKRKSTLNIIGGSLISSLLFFLITNFAVWLAWYPQTTEGFIECYTLAMPFLDKTIVSDLLFTGVFVGGFVLAQTRIPALAKVKA